MSASLYRGFPNTSVGKETAFNPGDTGGAVLILGSGRSPGVGNGNPLQCSCPDNSMDRGAWWAIVQRVIKSQTQWHEHKTKHLCTIHPSVHIGNPPKEDYTCSFRRLNRASRDIWVALYHLITFEHILATFRARTSTTTSCLPKIKFVIWSST